MTPKEALETKGEKKMKKLLFILPLMLLTGCSGSSYITENERAEKANFEKICSHKVSFQEEINYLKDIDTNLIYIKFHDGYKGSISVYYNSNGKPMTYDEFQIIHIKKYHN